MTPRFGLGFVVGVVAVFLVALPAWSQPLVLITDAESKLPPAPQAADRALTRGPEIVVESPAADRPVTSPVRLRIVFKTRGGVPIDPDSIEMRYLKTPVVLLTARTKSFIKPAGILIEEAQVPPGEHVIQIVIKDQDERETRRLLKFVVTPN